MKSIILVLMTLTCFLFTGLARADFAPVNPRFTKWIKEKKAADSVITNRKTSSATSTEKEHQIPPLTRRPSPVNNDNMKDKSIVPVPVVNKKQAIAVPTETTYDLRSLGLSTPMRDQNPYGTCWTFAAMASSESSALVQNYGTKDFSEKHLAYYGYADINSTLVGYDITPKPAPNSIYDQGGSDNMAIAILSRGTGLVSNATEPYEKMGPCAGDKTLPAGVAPIALAPNNMILQNVYFAPGGNSIVGNIKYLVKNYGAVSISIEYNDNYFDSTYNSFFQYTGYQSTNHAVTVVGWDDNFSRNNFNTQQTSTNGDPVIPNNNGAWIVKNSWGTWWGDSGYFYISYEDPGIVDEGGYAYQVAPVNKNSYMYSYTPLGVTGKYAIGSPETQWMANIFTSQDNHKLEQISLYTVDIDIAVTFYVYTGPDGTDPHSGTLKYTSSPTTLDTAGYFTLDLDTPVALKKGEKFSVVVKLESSGVSFPIPIERIVAEYSSKATAAPGQSFISADGISWQDLTQSSPNSNVCIRAIATETDDAAMIPVRMILLD